ncbi:N-acetylglucosaminidase [Sporosarcina sp. P3]|uniref:N-acetylglucosaminidase n=1 Tax=Sporosarcina sp. P3 TaxID=2048245 RepID=UPI00117B884F|nr:glucosaminidase domain-containing protein [Sporosarcina sp. P3]
MKSLTKLITTIAVTFLVAFALTLSAEAASWQDHSPDQNPDKPWIVTFSKPVNKNTVSKRTIYIKDSKGVTKDNEITYSDSDKKVHIAPPAGNYRSGETYTLYITQAVENTEGTPLKTPVTKTFSIKAGVTYDLAHVQANGTTTVVEKFPSFEAAASRMNSHQVVLFQNRIIHMPSGLISTVPYGGSSLTILYTDEKLNNQETYVPADTELVYVDSTATSVKVELAGRNFYIKPQNAMMLPSQTVTDRTHYKVKKESLYHLIYSHKTQKYAAYEMGAAPSFMQEGIKYYSTDGSHFHNETGALIGTAHQYFQYLPMRSMTRYTADELDAYIMKQLQILEESNPTTYKNATTRSKLIGLGTELKRIEQESYVNAMHILALAQHESQYGLSKRALENNNLFGLYVRDDNPSNQVFATVSENIQELVDSFLNKNYLPPGAVYANGTNFGNKAIGMNVKYASDPYWGSKIAGHLYRMDRSMGGKEIANQLKIGLTNPPSLNVRPIPSSASGTPTMYTYQKMGMPLIILDEQLPEAPWIKIRSDKAPYGSLYVHGDYVDRLEWQ